MKYRQLIEAYFRSINCSTRNYRTDECRKYVQKYRKDFAEGKFIRAASKFLVEMDDELPDYSE